MQITQEVQKCLVCGSDNALTGVSLLLSVYLYMNTYRKKNEKRQVVGGGVLSIVAAHSLPPSSHNTILALIEGTLKDISGHFRTSYAFL